jgi:hypothetical protein
MKAAILTISVLALAGCGAVETNTTAKSADGLSWPACIEWIDSLEGDGKTVRTGKLVCSADENELKALTPELSAAIAKKHPKVDFHTVPVQK